jgi:hypothetical protein
MGKGGLSFDAVVLVTGCKKATLNGSVRNIDYRLSSLLVLRIKSGAEKLTSMIFLDNDQLATHLLYFTTRLL